jgi:uncharacterized protein DUF4434
MRYLSRHNAVIHVTVIIVAGIFLATPFAPLLGRDVMSRVAAQSAQPKGKGKSKPAPKEGLLEKTAVAAQAGRPSRLSGGFIQYDNDSRSLSKAEWKQIIGLMQAAGMDTVIIQWVRHIKADEYDFDFFTNPNGVDPTAEILGYVEENNKDKNKSKMQVFIGLEFNEDWWGNAESVDAAYFQKLEADSKRSADAVWERYGKPGKYKTAFAGWYLPHETWNVAYSEGQITTLRKFFKNVSIHCKKGRGNKPLAISPIFSPIHYAAGTPAVVEQVYTSLLTGSGIDILMVQDGVGARVWDTKEMIDEYVPPYLTAFANASRKASEANQKNKESGIEFWANLEAFVQMHNGDRDNQPWDAKPACITRLKWQVEAAQSVSGLKKLVTFDFFHYMNSVTKALYQLPLCERSRLYCSYIREFVPENKSCQTYIEEAGCTPIKDRHCPF